MNILPIIALFLETFSKFSIDHLDGRAVYSLAVLGDIPRVELLKWLTHFIGNTDELDLILDCMAAAGIGRLSEQIQTVHCHCTGLGQQLLCGSMGQDELAESAARQDVHLVT